MDLFSPWAILDVAVGRLGHIENLWAVLVGAVFGLWAVYGPELREDKGRKGKGRGWRE